jgi:hypothetical protein
MLLYRPAPHAVHLALPTESDDWPALQWEHPVAFWSSLTFPMSHSWHACMPVTFPNHPGKHGRQDAWPSAS